MHIPKQSFHYFSVIGAGLALLLCSDCVSTPATPQPESLQLATVHSQVSAAVASMERATPQPQGDTGIFSLDMTQEFADKKGVLVFEVSPQSPAAAAGLRAGDILIAFDGKAVSDGKSLGSIIQQLPPEKKFTVEFVRGKKVGTTTMTFGAIPPELTCDRRGYAKAQSGDWDGAIADYTEAIRLNPGIASLYMARGLAKIKRGDLDWGAADYNEAARRTAELAAKEEAESFTKSTLSDLLASTDMTEFLARERNRAIIAAKNQELPAILREKKTDELSALVVKIEQAILDLDHECEVAKDRAQQATATNGAAQPIEELRGLAISYRERIELLKPMLTALKDEIANRAR